jgi:hypothetical protein
MRQSHDECAPSNRGAMAVARQLHLGLRESLSIAGHIGQPVAVVKRHSHASRPRAAAASS